MPGGPEPERVRRLVRDALATPALRRLQVAWTLCSVEGWAFNGRPRRARLPGRKGVGEIALLRDVPRTATVTVATRLELRALDREAFLGAVAGSRRALAAARGIAAEREPSLTTT